MELARVLEKALRNMEERPRDLATSLEMMLRFEGLSPDSFSVKDILQALEGEEENSVALTLGRCLWQWDYTEAPAWAEQTPPQTLERREVVYRLLGLVGDVRDRVTRRLPLSTTDRPTVIAEKHELWYPPPELSQFYWNAYVKYLRERNGWNEDSVNSLHESTTAIIQRIANPTAEKIYQSKGLVVGYVQSGKTANFTGLIAKAADAGYRLFIVLGGLLDILRNQTQRRIDKELIGKELLRKGGGHEYQNDSEWDSFAEHGVLPSELGHFDWQRLTGQEDDFRSLARGIEALEFERVDPRLPFYATKNLQRAKARLIVIKKNPARIEKLMDDLRALRSKLADVPALVIDDESDQAGVNTRKPTPDRKERSKTNKAITDLLQVLPRAQYVGYTATPFANVFVDPEDAVDLFPKDFIVSLPRPIGYMGVDSFYDLDLVRYDDRDPRSNYRAFVRDVEGDDDEPRNLQRAIDSFVLAGAIKLLRQKARPDLAKRYRHHTMLVHQSAFKEKHDVTAELVQEVVNKAGYFDGSGFKRLVALWSEDFQPVCAARSGGLPSPSSFDELRPFIGPCLLKCARPDDLERHVRIVNGDYRDDTPDFDKSPVWGILVGGTKLSRGYTIEGLTVSYYRRATSTSDTLMQMGRWFGYRGGYQDLVRLFIGRREPLDKKGRRHLDLYEAFHAICEDEMTFRRELERYAAVDDPRVLPRHIPPLVTVHRPDLLRPSASNKMYNAELRYMDFGGTWSEPTLAPTEEDSAGVSHNIAATRALLNGTSDLRSETLSARVGTLDLEFEAVLAVLSPSDVLTFLENYAWAKDQSGKRKRALTAQLGFLQSDGDLRIDRWLFVAPQTEKTTVGIWRHAGHDFRLRHRARVEDGGERYKVYTEPQHREVALVLCGSGTGVATNSPTKALVHERQGIMLFYPVRDSKSESDKMISVGFALYFPGNRGTLKVKFGVNDPSRPDDVVVQVPGQAADKTSAGSARRRT